MVLKYRLIPPHNGLYTGFDREYFFGRVNASEPPGKAGKRGGQGSEITKQSHFHFSQVACFE